VRRLVEKRALMFLTLAILVWAISISSLAGYFYLQNTMYTEQIGENQQSANKTASNYDELMSKYNTLLSEYSILYGSYSFPQGVNFTLLMEPLGRLIDSLKGNYGSLLMDQKGLNETYCTLEEDCQLVCQEGNVTREDFGRLLNECYDLSNLLAIRELSLILSETVTLNVNVCIDYGNGTINWHNETRTPTGSSLFQLTQKISAINYTYYSSMKPGHVLMDSINDKKAYTVDYSEGWSWIWYYWDGDEQSWISGPVGCDAWMLKNGGIYKWRFEHWSWP
jgi:hypothetical protein